MMNKKDKNKQIDVIKRLPFTNVYKYDDDNFYIAFFDYNEGERLIINNKFADEILNICLNEKGCRFIKESHYYSYKNLESFTKILKKHNIEYETEWFDIEY